MTDSTPKKTLTLSIPSDSSGESNTARRRSGPRAARVAAQRPRQTQENTSTRTQTGTRPSGFQNDKPSRGGATTRDDQRPSTRSARPATRTAAPTARERDHSAAPRQRSARHESPAAAPRTRQRQFKAFAPCPQGLEDVLYTELQALGYEDVKQARGGCHFQCDWAGVLKANLNSRIATRILIQIAHAPVHNEDDIYELTVNTRWEDWFGASDTLRVDTSAIRSPMQSLQFCNLKVKDGICDRLRHIEGARPDVDTVRPDAKVHLFLDESTATLYLDTSGESLFKRGWRHHKGEAPLRENLAAGILALANWDPNQALIDPFCGSGTILIEAAWIALGAPPGIWRPFHFERLRNHNPRLWRDLKEEARAHIAPKLDIPLIGYDLNPDAIDAAKANLERAHLSSDTIRFIQADALTMEAVAEEGYIVSNPPYGERLGSQDLSFWHDWSGQLKAHFGGWNMSLITSDLELPKHLRLKPKQRIPLYNGALECRLFNFELVSAGYR